MTLFAPSTGVGATPAYAPAPPMAPCDINLAGTEAGGVQPILLEALPDSALARGARYPDCRPLASLFASQLGIADECVLVTAGADEALERAAITCNKNGIPNDPLPPVKTSGIRVGSPAGTTRGFGPAEFREIGNMVADVLDGLRKNGEQGDAQVEANVRERVRTLCERFPIYPGA